MRTAPVPVSVTTVGGLLPADLLGKVMAGEGLDGLREQDYHLPGGERIGEAVSRSWNRLTGTWSSFRQALASAEPGAATGLTRERWLQVLFAELGYGRLQTARAIELDGTAFPVSHAWGATPIHLVGARVELDRRAAGVAGAARKSPHGLVQELLNRSDERLWGVVANGLRLRVLRDNVRLTRPAYVEFDLEGIFDGDLYADFRLLWLVAHQSRVEAPDGKPHECWLERWSQAAQEQGTRALDQLRVGVEAAIQSLGTGFLAFEGNRDLRDRLRSGALDRQDYYRQLLRLVYRLLFLFVAEERDFLLPRETPDEVRGRYEAWYSTRRLRRLAERRRGGAHPDLYTGLRVVMDALGRAEGCPPLGLPALGGLLWSAAALPDLAAAGIANGHLLAAVHALAFVDDKGSQRLVDWRNLGSDELGSVYESLLELHPELHVEQRSFGLTSAGGSERKTTGSYYTPTALINQLLETALDPVLDEATAAEDPEAAILDLRVVDPAVGSGHFLIAAAHRIAKRLAAVRTGDDEPGPRELRRALRDVIGRCVYGVDVNPMALELAKVALWMESMEPGRPLPFLDHHFKVGDSLLGATPALVAGGIPDDAFRPIEGDDKLLATSYRKRNKAQRGGQAELFAAAETRGTYDALSGAYAAIDALDDRSLAGVRAKEERYAALQSSPQLAHARLIADAWCAAFVWPLRASAPPPITHEPFTRLRTDPTALPRDTHTEVTRLAAQYEFFHWHLAFPDVFQLPADPEDADNPETGWNGGFDVVLGNPPWERVKLQEKEWFAVRRPEIATAPNAAKRKALIRDLAAENPPVLYQAFNEALREAEGVSHLLRASGRYPLCGRGDVNTYAIFAELNRSLVGPTGRAGFIVPTGIATDFTTQDYFRTVVDTKTIASLYDFENRRKVFAGIDSRIKFCLLTLSGRQRPVEQPEYAFFLLGVPDLADPDVRFTLTAADIALLNPNTRTCPIFRSRRDAEITKGIYRRVPVLVDESREDGNPWGVTFSTMFHMSNDSHLFRTRAELESDGWTLHGNTFTRGPDRYLPLYEGRFGHQFDHRFAEEHGSDLRPLSASEHGDASRLVEPAVWIADRETTSRLERKGLSCRTALLGLRRVARNTDERTAIAALIPFGAASYGWILSLGPDARDLSLLATAYNSYAFDYLLRGALSQPSLPQSTIEQIPVPGSDEVGPFASELLLKRALELTYTAYDMRSYSEDLGVYIEPSVWHEERRWTIRRELDAAYFHLYGIEREDVDYIMETFPIIKRKDVQRYGEYRTKCVILEIYDLMAKAIESGEAYPTVLDPPPGDDSLRHPPRSEPGQGVGQ